MRKSWVLWRPKPPSKKIANSGLKILIILNSISRKKKKFYHELLPVLQRHFQVTVFETQYAGHAKVLAQDLASQYDVMLAAGGDGTLNQVLNGMMTGATEPRPSLGIIPLGTGNDFARMFNIKATGEHIVSRLQQKSFPSTDVGCIETVNEQGVPVKKYFINVCSLGMGPEVVTRLSKSNRSLGPTLTYLKAITQTFFTHRPQPVQVTADNWSWSGWARVVGIANGKSFGNGMYIAPDAEVNDGLFSTFIASDLPLFKFLLYLQTIKSGKILRDSKIAYQTASAISLSSSQPTPIEAEGELQGWLPAKIFIQAGAVKFVR